MIRIIRETHDTPDAVVGELVLAGGYNRFGEPNYRAVWGWSRLGWIGGKWKDHDSVGALVREVVELRQEPKYFPHDRWHIERWIGPEEYGSATQWYAETIEMENGLSIPALGPYPSRGEYEHCFTVEGPSGEFLQLTPAVARHIARGIEVSRNTSRVRRKEAIDDRSRRADRDYDSFADAVLTDACPAFGGAAHVGVIA